VVLAVLSAALFGAATPATKSLLSELTPFQLAGLLYLGAAVGILPLALRSGGIRLPPPTDRRNRLRLAGAVAAGGIAGPVLLLLGLSKAAASSVSLWLNLEVVATALLGVLIFREHFRLQGWLGIAAALAGALTLSLTAGNAGFAAGGLVLLACICWGIDNHLTALIDGITVSQSTFWKGVVAGTTNLTLGLLLDPLAADPVSIGSAVFVGTWAYGVSIALYITAAQALGATRAQVAFASAPFFGVLFSVLALGEPLTIEILVAGILMFGGIALLTRERHAHVHEHGVLEHEHAHRHDDGHHLHAHAESLAVAWHTHRHRHESIVHAHPHWPDLHHRHGHERE
jgi:drug/metabolite transporter (DMT)-like permease